MHVEQPQRQSFCQYRAKLIRRYSRNPSTMEFYDDALSVEPNRSKDMAEKSRLLPPESLFCQYRFKLLRAMAGNPSDAKILVASQPFRLMVLLSESGSTT